MVYLSIPARRDLRGGNVIDHRAGTCSVRYLRQHDAHAHRVKTRHTRGLSPRRSWSLQLRNRRRYAGSPPSQRTITHYCQGDLACPRSGNDREDQHVGPVHVHRVVVVVQTKDVEQEPAVLNGLTGPCHDKPSCHNLRILESVCPSDVVIGCVTHCSATSSCQ